MIGCTMGSTMSALVLLLLSFVTPPAPQAPDYAGLYTQGVPYAEFLDGVRSRADGWKRNSSSATVAADIASRVKAIDGRRRILVVGEASCSDSVSTIPYLAKLVETAPDRLEMRIVDSTLGRAVMEAHRAPDGRAATPTVVVLDGNGAFIGAWVERPAELQKWYDAQKPVIATRELTAQKMKWYEADAGRSTLAEVVALLTR